MNRVIENLMWRIINFLPRKFVFMCFCKIVGECTTGIYSDTVLPDLTVSDISKRYKI